ncbi:MAG: PDZ domain-containing protein [Proteobacteria bacterium]|nr:PDZ domain-containing protein [Pseudomonadota bacterium]
MGSKLKKYAGLILVVIVALLASYVTFWSPGRGGLELNVDDEGASSRRIDPDVPLEMRSLQTLYRTINLVQKRYIDAARIDSRAMFVAAMRAIQGQIAQVIVAEKGDNLVVRLINEEKIIPLGDIRTPWILLQRTKEVFSFLEKGLTEEEVDFKKIEYAAINGMLQTLDPHSSFLDPDQYRDMKDRTRGKFGGLGIVISIRDGVLTIISPIAGTPADLAGLKAGDQIIKIGEMSTVNMSLNDAVGFLRGDPGTTIRVHCLRKGWEEPRPFTIVRAIIKVESLETHLLPGQVGYVKVKDFQSNTPHDLRIILAEWEKKSVRGLVIDLRGCPGGLLEAAVQVSDIFLKKGVIVTTAGQGPTDRDIRYATDSGEEPDYPIVVLVNRGSASASEIVAGALGNHKRALLVGERTFGKGSVQVLYDFHDGSALKMTTAQYLTPGDISIQSVGVVPTVELRAMRADKEMLDLTSEDGYRERDLQHHFEGTSDAGHSGTPQKSISYLVVPKNLGKEKGQQESDKQPAVADEKKQFEPDFAIDLGRDLVGKMASLKKRQVKPEALFATLETKAKQEDKKLVTALQKLGINWKVGRRLPGAKALVTARMETPGPLKAGEEGKLIVAVTNKGSGAFYRLFATSRSDFYPLRDRELAFGKVEPGETVERELSFKVPKNVLEQTSDVLWSFTAVGEQKVEPIALRFSVEAFDRPQLAYSLQVNDVEGGNGDSRLQPGETVKLVMDMKNVGSGTAFNTHITLKNLVGKDLFMIGGREALGEMKPNEQRRGIFSFEIKPQFDKKEVRFELGLGAVDIKVFSIETIEIPIEKALAVTKAHKTLSASSAAVNVYGKPSKEALVTALLPKGSRFDVEAETERFYRVRLDKERIGWIAKDAPLMESVDKQEGADEKDGSFELVFNTSPIITIETSPRVVQSPTVHIEGKAVDETQVRNVYIFVGIDKVFYKPNSDNARINELPFKAEIPLKYGLNHIYIVAEQTVDVDSRQIIVIRRDRADGMSYFLPRSMTGSPEPIGVVPMK